MNKRASLNALLIVLLMVSLFYSAKSDENDEPSSDSTSEARVVGGDYAVPHEFPWMAHLLITFLIAGIKKCGGSLIDKQWVLTAAHCLSFLDPGTKQIENATRVIVKLGKHDLSNVNEGGEQNQTSSRIIIHRNFTHDDYSFDYALIKLTNPVRITREVDVIALPNSNLCQATYYDETSEVVDGCGSATASGWGITEEGTVSKVLKKVKLDIRDSGACAAVLQWSATFSDTKICAGGIDGQDTCRGDSGGPLFCKDDNGWPMLLGVTSYGSADCSTITESPGVYSRVCRALPWIRSLVVLAASQGCIPANLPRIPNGSLERGNSNVGAIIAINCNRGYTLEGEPSYVMCRNNGLWTQPTAECRSSNSAVSPTTTTTSTPKNTFISTRTLSTNMNVFTNGATTTAPQVSSRTPGGIGVNISQTNCGLSNANGAALRQLEPETYPRPHLRGYSTISGVCDASSGSIPGETYSGRTGTLKACAKRCADLANCNGYNFVTDSNQCTLFETVCEQTNPICKTDPTQNFYLKGEIGCSTSTVGNEFYVAFMANRVAQPANLSLEIWVTQDSSQTDAIVTVEFDESQTLDGSNQPRTIRVPFKQAVKTLIPFNWKLSDVDRGVTVEKKGLKLSSDTDFVLYGVNKEFFTADAFLGIPSRALGTSYVANCHWPSFYNCEFAITPIFDDTTVTITLPRASATNNNGNWAKPPTVAELAVRCRISYLGRSYTNGDTFTIQLSLFDVAQIQDSCDLTGAIIEANKPVAVWSGDSRVNVGDSPSRDHQVEELFSTDTWGTDCAAWPTPRRAPGLTDYWVITAASDNTRVRIDSSEKATSYQTLNSGDSVRFPANSVNEWQRFSTEGGKKIQVVKYAHSAVDNSIPGDPSMTICIPTDQFGFRYTFVTPTGVSSPYTNYLTIITNDGSQNGFILDGQPVTGVTWQRVPNSNLVGGFVELGRSKQQFRIEHKIKGTTFEAYIYGSGDRESIAYPTGACIKALGECSISTMFIADGKDNDCDGVIDEELLDGIDNDLDGRVDEDCYDRRPRPRSR